MQKDGNAPTVTQDDSCDVEAFEGESVELSSNAISIGMPSPSMRLNLPRIVDASINAGHRRVHVVEMLGHVNFNTV